MPAFFSNLWARIKAACLNSATMAWSYVVTAVGTFFENVDSLATVLGDPNFSQQMQTVIGDAKLIGKWLLAVGVVTAIARMRSLVLTKRTP